MCGVGVGVGSLDSNLSCITLTMSLLLASISRSVKVSMRRVEAAVRNTYSVGNPGILKC